MKIAEVCSTCEKVDIKSMFCKLLWDNTKPGASCPKWEMNANAVRMGKYQEALDKRRKQKAAMVRFETPYDEVYVEGLGKLNAL